MLVRLITTLTHIEFHIPTDYFDEEEDEDDLEFEDYGRDYEYEMSDEEYYTDRHGNQVDKEDLEPDLECLVAKNLKTEANLESFGLTPESYKKISRALYQKIMGRKYPSPFDGPNEWTKAGGHLDQRALFTLFEAKYNCAPITHLLVGAQKYDTKLLHESINPSFNVSILSLGP